MQPNDLSKPYHYLGGPMTGIPQFNFPRFLSVAQKLREADYHIANPAELDDPDKFERSFTSPDGDDQTLVTYSEGGKDLLRRDVNIVMDPNCVGIICLEGWEDSTGALIETFIADRFGKETLLYFDRDDGKFDLMPFDRDDSLRAHIHAIQKSITDSIPYA